MFLVTTVCLNNSSGERPRPILAQRAERSAPKDPRHPGSGGGPEIGGAPENSDQSNRVDRQSPRDPKAGTPARSYCAVYKYYIEILPVAGPSAPEPGAADRLSDQLPFYRLNREPSWKWPFNACPVPLASKSGQRLI